MIDGKYLEELDVTPAKLTEIERWAIKYIQEKPINDPQVRKIEQIKILAQSWLRENQESK